MEGIKIVDKYVGLNEDIVYLQIIGYIDTTTSIELVHHLKDLMSKGNYQFVVDMGGVNYVSSAGWGVFVGEIKDVRDNGGDIKIVHMTPEVRDVFEMLEFNRILKEYESIPEAINEFDYIRGFDITKARIKELPAEERLRETQPAAKEDVTVLIPEKRQAEGVGAEIGREHPQTDPQFMPLAEKIKLIIVENPLVSFWQIHKQLRSERFGKTKIGIYALHKLLKEMNLDSKERRMRFYRSR